MGGDGDSGPPPAPARATAWRRACACAEDWIVRAVGGVLRVGAVPGHLALIMDGNRRYARRRNQRQRAGHEAGFDALLRVMEWSFALGVGTLTVFCFSLENFRRDGGQVAELMALLEEKLEDLLRRARGAGAGAGAGARAGCAGEDVLGRYRVRVRVVGDLSMFPAGVRRSCAELMERTRQHSGPAVNICMGYTSTSEICRRLRSPAPGGDAGAGALPRAFADGGVPPVDLLIRTSGEERLSDFMLVEVREAAVLLFLAPLWPELSFAHFAYAILEYQSQTRARRRAEAVDRERRRTL